MVSALTYILIGNAPPPRGKTPDRGSEGRSPRRDAGGEAAYEGGSQGGIRGRGRRRGGKGVGGEKGDKESKKVVSREMFVIGGAGTDPIKVR